MDFTLVIPKAEWNLGYCVAAADDVGSTMDVGKGEFEWCGRMGVAARRK
ncbi:hypothetical protein L195_g043353, partial [Trifolium pratense]